jgi:small ligand-binding sensory domain FIST
MGLIDMSDVQAALSFVALGVSLNPLIEDMDEQEYIVRPISDLEKDGPVMLTEPVRVGQIVRFHVRDAENAKAELDSLMMRWKLEKGQKGLDGMFPAGALLFTDESRGRRLYSEDGVEVSKFRETFPGVSMGGGYFTGAIGELPNFSSASKAQKKAPVAPAEGGMTRESPTVCLPACLGRVSRYLIRVESIGSSRVPRL